MSYYDDELALREAKINRKRKRNRKRLLVGAGVAAGGALALNNDKIRNKVTNHLRSDSQMMNNIGNGVRKVGKGIYNNFKPSATTMSIKRGAERAADAISNYTPKYNKRRRKLANIIDDIYHSAYSDGYYAGMELYHADDEMTEEERRARRRKRRRNIALGVAGVAGAGAAGYAIGRALYGREKSTEKPRKTVTVKRWKYPPDDERPKAKRNIHGFRRSTGSYKVPNTSEHWIPFSVARDRKLKRK